MHKFVAFLENKIVTQTFNCNNANNVRNVVFTKIQDLQQECMQRQQQLMSKLYEAIVAQMELQTFMNAQTSTLTLMHILPTISEQQAWARFVHPNATYNHALIQLAESLQNEEVEPVDEAQSKVYCKLFVQYVCERLSTISWSRENIDTHKELIVACIYDAIDKAEEAYARQKYSNIGLDCYALSLQDQMYSERHESTNCGVSLFSYDDLHHGLYK